MILNRRRRAEELGDIEWWDQLRVINILVGSVPRHDIAHYSIHGCADVLITDGEGGTTQSGCIPPFTA